MPKLFGVDIAAAVAKGLGPGLPSAILSKVTQNTRTTGALTAGLNAQSADSPCKAFIEDYSVHQMTNTMITVGDRKVTILGATLPTNTVPMPSDKITIEGSTYTIVRVTRDPAAATYECQVRGS